MNKQAIRWNDVIAQDIFVDIIMAEPGSTRGQTDFFGPMSEKHSFERN